MKEAVIMAEQKTNVMRTLEQKKIPYTAHSYPHGDEAVDGVQVAQLIGRPVEQVYKTLVAVGASKKNYVFVIPADHALDLKKAARSVGEKAVSMIPVKDINKVTGYIRGGCSPIGMKKAFPTYVDERALEHETITVSAGVRGAQLLLDRAALLQFIQAKTAPITVKYEN